uniref:Uncharacterized protein n=1 Tax=Arundo donax TaxID=35708 RepID=A0A0A9DQ92_ARUDO
MRRSCAMKSIIAMSVLMMLLTGHAALTRIWRERARSTIAEGVGPPGSV